MKSLGSLFGYFVHEREARQNLGVLLKYLLVLFGVVALYTIVFHLIMDVEGQDHSWVTGLYWTLVVMSTLGFGDITFHSDAGRAFSILVLMSGLIFLLVVLPFAFIQFFVAPWLEERSAMRTPRAVPNPTSRTSISSHAV